MPVPEIERLSDDKITRYLEYVKANKDIIVSVDVKEHADFEGFTKITVEFKFLKRLV